MFGFFLDKGLISANQWGFKPGDSYINQLLSITHYIYKSLDDGYEVRDVFLDISKVFDKVWQDGLIQITRKWDIGELVKIFKTFFDKYKIKGCIKWAVFLMG